MKTGISKAYDRVEWSFLEATMKQLGFDPQWVALTMECVQFVSYSVLINGLTYGNFKPTRGLRQGDAMSPYLFLLCVEVLSQMLDRAQCTNQMQGMRLARRCPRVSHLFFADDSLFGGCAMFGFSVCTI